MLNPLLTMFFRSRWLDIRISAVPFLFVIYIYIYIYIYITKQKNSADIQAKHVY